MYFDPNLCNTWLFIVTLQLNVLIGITMTWSLMTGIDTNSSTVINVINRHVMGELTWSMDRSLRSWSIGHIIKQCTPIIGIGAQKVHVLKPVQIANTGHKLSVTCDNLTIDSPIIYSKQCNFLLLNLWQKTNKQNLKRNWFIIQIIVIFIFHHFD